MSLLVDFAFMFTGCPCCCEHKRCLDDCTYNTDFPDQAFQMVLARAALAEHQDLKLPLLADEIVREMSAIERELNASGRHRSSEVIRLAINEIVQLNKKETE